MTVNSPKDTKDLVITELENEAKEELKKLILDMISVKDGEIILDDNKIIKFLRENFNILDLMKSVGYETGYVAGYLDGQKRKKEQDN